MALADMRKDYGIAGLLEQDLAQDPFRQFDRWFQEALAAKLPEPNACVLATADRDARPLGRVMLLKGVDAHGFTFFTNHGSRKGRALDANPHAALVFPWFPMERQVVVEGPVTRVAREEAEAYFHSRPRMSQLGAWASQQSAVVASRAALEENFQAAEKKYAGQEVPLPPHWGGYRLAPDTVEFWQGRASRLHDRLRYRRERGAWIVERLAP
ncbi:MAG TPA: pyridoxamine 5'-phosphate oxidase [Opitutaceae bacterium]|nr:pyridoxamine 5'-phosphate oxidase [Opitutaceae bacterium]